MTSTVPLQATTIPGEQRVVLQNISWAAYEQILEALGNHRAAHLTYDQGNLEIMVPLEPHESSSDLIGLLIRILTEELNLNLKSLRSTTLKRPDLKRSPEADNCYYIQNEPLVRGKVVDLTQDPPPDLVMEVEISHSDIDKLDLYARMGIPEFWRFNGKTLEIYQLQAGTYRSVEQSPTFAVPWFSKTVLYAFLEQCKVQGETQATKALRSWVREQLQ